MNETVENQAQQKDRLYKRVLKTGEIGLYSKIGKRHFLTIKHINPAFWGHGEYYEYEYADASFGEFNEYNKNLDGKRND